MTDETKLNAKKELRAEALDRRKMAFERHGPEASRKIAAHGVDFLAVSSGAIVSGFAAINDLVLVRVNFRVGVLGFLDLSTVMDDPAYTAKAARVSALAKDISEFLAEIELPPSTLGEPPTVAYHPACSLQHGQGITEAPKQLLAAAGFRVRAPDDAHLCCGSAGTYNILQPVIAAQLGDRKVQTLERLDAEVIATGNIGCATQIGVRARLPVVHTVELLDWAAGGPRPAALSNPKA